MGYERGKGRQWREQKFDGRGFIIHGKRGETENSVSSSGGDSGGGGIVVVVISRLSWKR